SSDDAIIGAAADGSIVNWNSGAEHMFGYLAAEIQGSPISALFEEDIASHTGTVRKVIGFGESIQRYEAKGARKSGEPIDLAVTISPIRNSDGTAGGVSAI